jgi:hypothetical protein
MEPGLSKRADKSLNFLYFTYFADAAMLRKDIVFSKQQK